MKRLFINILLLIVLFMSSACLSPNRTNKYDNSTIGLSFKYPSYVTFSDHDYLDDDTIELQLHISIIPIKDLFINDNRYSDSEKVEGINRLFKIQDELNKGNLSYFGNGYDIVKLNGFYAFRSIRFAEYSPDNVMFNRYLTFYYKDNKIDIELIGNIYPLIYANQEYFEFAWLHDDVYNKIINYLSNKDKELFNDYYKKKDNTYYLYNPGDNDLNYNRIMKIVCDYFLSIKYYPKQDDMYYQWRGIIFEQIEKHLIAGKGSEDILKWYNTFNDIINTIELK